MIRVVILADSSTRAHDVSEMLAEDSEIEVMQAGVANAEDERELSFADVVVAAGLDSEFLQSMTTSTVVLAKSNDEPHWPPSVRAWLPVNAEVSEVLAAVHAAAQNLTALTQAQAARWLPSQPAASMALEEQLTARELQVLRRLADGSGNKDIAAALHLSEHTVKFHVGQILGKLGAVSRAEAVALGIRRGLVPL